MPGAGGSPRCSTSIPLPASGLGKQLKMNQVLGPLYSLRSPGCCCHLGGDQWMDDSLSLPFSPLYPSLSFSLSL